MNKLAIYCIGHSRPEMMKLSAEALFNCHHIELADVFYSIDGDISHTCLEKHNFKDGEYSGQQTGLSKHIMMSIRRGFDLGYSKVAIIEDDIIVSRDFIDYLLFAFTLKDDDCFSVSGYSRRCEPISEDKNRLVCKADWYHPWGVAFDQKDFELLEPHITERYFSNKKKYMEENILHQCRVNNPQYFKYAFNGSYNTLQAGLINSIRAMHVKRQIMPCMSRCQNIGYYGANQNSRSYNGDNLREKRVQMKAQHYMPKFQEDCEWDKLILTEDCIKNSTFCVKK